MRFFRNGCVTDFCSCKIGIPYILYISSVLKSSCILYTLRFSARRLLGLRPRPAGQPLAVVSASLRLLALIAMEGMYAGFAGAKACQKKSELIEAPFNLSRKQIGVYDLFPKQSWLELSNV